MNICDGRQATASQVPEQVSHAARCRMAAPLLAPPLLAFVLALGGCGSVERFYESKLSPDTPVQWWNQLQGGRIGEQRPPPPGAADPYPNLAEVPARPTPTDPAARRALQARLAGERDSTARDAANDPLPALGAAATAAAASRPEPAADPNASMATLDAAEAPPARAVPALRPAVPALPDVRTAAKDSGPLPDLPTAPPSAPRLAGVPAVTAPTSREPSGVVLAFRPGSAELPPDSDVPLRALAGRRGNAAILVSASGDASGPGLTRQEASLPLALRRARAVADALVAAGVPEGAVRLSASALGRGASARLVE